MRSSSSASTMTRSSIGSATAGTLSPNGKNENEVSEVFRQFFSQAAELKSAREIGLMRESGKIVAEALRLCREMAKPGVRTIDIDRAVDALYANYGATPLFKGYGGPNPKHPFPASTCLSLNEQVVHGIPGQREIREGDIIKVDT